MTPDTTDLRATVERLQSERDAARGQVAYMLEAFWLAIADLPHAEWCALATCDHRIECPHVNVDCTCPDRACVCECSCWRTAADKVTKVDEALQLCERVRDLEDRIEVTDGSYCVMRDEVDRQRVEIERLRSALDATRNEIERLNEALLDVTEDPTASLASVGIARAALSGSVKP